MMRQPNVVPTGTTLILALSALERATIEQLTELQHLCDQGGLNSSPEKSFYGVLGMELPPDRAMDELEFDCSFIVPGDTIATHPYVAHIAIWVETALRARRRLSILMGAEIEAEEAGAAPEATFQAFAM